MITVKRASEKWKKPGQHIFTGHMLLLLIISKNFIIINSNNKQIDTSQMSNFNLKICAHTEIFKLDFKLHDYQACQEHWTIGEIRCSVVGLQHFKYVKVNQ